MSGLLLLLSVNYNLLAQNVEPRLLTKGVFKHEISFGDENIPRRFMLTTASNIPIKVNNNSDIYAFNGYINDGGIIKIFDKNGNPKDIIVNSAIDNVPLVEMSPLDYLTIRSDNLATGGLFIVYNPNNELTQKHIPAALNFSVILLKDYNINVKINLSEWRLIALDDQRYIIACNTLHAYNYKKDDEYYDYLFLADAEKLTLLAQYKNTNTFMFQYIGLNKDMSSYSSISKFSIPEFGKFLWAFYSNDKVIYTHTAHDVVYNNDNTAELTFHIITTSGEKVKDIKFVYIPENIPDFRLADNQSLIIGNEENNIKYSDKKDLVGYVKNKLKEKKYLPFITRDMIIDGDYLFVFPWSYQRDRYMLCIDITSGNYLSKSLLLPSDTYVNIIKDGYVYDTGTRRPEGYAVIEKYSIDKAVYGK
jgi:hypothetical protein